MYKETCSNYQIAKDEHYSFKIVGSSLLQAQHEAYIKRVHDKPEMLCQGGKTDPKINK